MKCRTQAALAVGAGYLLGRTHKTKLALGLAAVAATGKFGGVSGQLIKRGTKLLGSTDALGKLAPQLTEVTELIRGDLVDAGKAAALTAVRGRIDNLSERIQDQADAFREGNLPGTDDLPGADDLTGGNGKPRRRRRDEEDRPRRRRRDEEEPADYEDAEDFDETADEDEPVRDEEEPEPVRDEDEPEPDRDEDEPEPVRDEDEPEDDEPEDDEPARPRRRAASSGRKRTRAAAGSAPVRRARR